MSFTQKFQVVRPYKKSDPENKSKIEAGVPFERGATTRPCPFDPSRRPWDTVRYEVYGLENKYLVTARNQAVGGQSQHPPSDSIKACIQPWLGIALSQCGATGTLKGYGDDTI